MLPGSEDGRAASAVPRWPWRGVDDLELATLSWVHWFNQNRLHSSLQNVPPIEYETEYYRQINARQQPLPGELSLH